MKINVNQDFFRKEGVEAPQETKAIVQPSEKVVNILCEAVETLRQFGMTELAAGVERMANSAKHERFVVSVIGEFNHGKSTFVNNLLNGAPMLPTAIVPTTAIMTRVRFAAKPQMVVIDEKGSVINRFPVKSESWKGLTVDNFGGKNPSGSVVVGINDDWLGHNNIEIVDCPGLNDLTTESANVTGDALSRTDGAIIAINATRPLGMSERTFINQRVLKGKTPYVMLIITMLDLVPLEERNEVVDYIIQSITREGWNIPVMIPKKIEMPDDRYSEIMGLDAIKNTIESWIKDPERQDREDARVKTAIADVLDIAISSIREKIKLCSIDEEKRIIEINRKKQKIEDIELEWGALSLELQKRSSDCYCKFLKKIDDTRDSIIEKLQLDASHAPKPAEWWANDYPYRLKMELAALSVQLDNFVQHTIIDDARWFNSILQQRFNTAVVLNSQNIANPDDYKDKHSNTNLKFEDINKKATIYRIGTAALSLGGFFLLPPGLGIIATMGIGTGGTILTGKFANKKLEEQHEMMKKAIAKDVPEVIANATESSERRVTAIYDDMLNQSAEKKDLWKKAQIKAVTEATSSNKDNIDRLEKDIIKLESIISKL